MLESAQPSARSREAICVHVLQQRVSQQHKIKGMHLNNTAVKYTKSRTQQHYNIHTGERPYKCKYCERTFTNYPNWLKHTRRRHKVDHKTGEDLEKPALKEEAPPTPAPVENSSETPLLQELALNKADELLLQQNLLSLSLPCDDKFVLQQQINFINGKLVVCEVPTAAVGFRFTGELDESPSALFASRTFPAEQPVSVAHAVR